MIKISVLHEEKKVSGEKRSGLSFLIQAGNSTILFDASIRDQVKKSLNRLKVKSDSIKFIVISHGHWDHTDGLQNLTAKNAIVVAHPACFDEKIDGHERIGSPLNLNQIKKKWKVILSDKPYNLSKNILFLGEIPRFTLFEGKSPEGKTTGNQPDFVMDDSALAITTTKGIIIVTGCSHSGIVNIIKYAIDKTGIDKIYAVIGGFHLFSPDQTTKTIQYLHMKKIKNLYPCHCISTYAKLKLKEIGAVQLSTKDQLVFEG